MGQRWAVAVPALMCCIRRQMYSEETSSPQRTHEGGFLRVIFRPHQIAGPVKQNKRAHRKPQLWGKKSFGVFFFTFGWNLSCCSFFFFAFLTHQVFSVYPGHQWGKRSAQQGNDRMLSSHTGPFATMMECRRSCCRSLRRTHAHIQARTELQWPPQWGMDFFINLIPLASWKRGVHSKLSERLKSQNCPCVAFAIECFRSTPVNPPPGCCSCTLKKKVISSAEWHHIKEKSCF